MNTKSSAWTGRAPRSMRQAFNPYTSNTLHPMRDPRDYSPRWWAAIVLIAIATVFAIAIFR